MNSLLNGKCLFENQMVIMEKKTGSGLKDT